MPDDIFDKVAAKMGAVPKGDIFDRVVAKMPVSNPEQQTISQLPNAAMQAKQQSTATIKPLIPGTGTIDPTGGGMAAAQAGQNPAYNEYQRQSGILAGTVAGTMGAGAIPALRVIPGAGLLKNIPGFIGRSLTSGIGAGTGALAGGATPEEAKVQAVGGAVGQPIAEGLNAGVIAPLIKWIGASKTTGAALLQQASAKVGNAPVELSPQTNVLVDEIVKNEKLGGKPVKAVTDLLRRLGPAPGQAAEAVPGPLTYDEGRLLYSNLGTELATRGENALQGRAKDLAYKFLNSLGRDVQSTAQAGGVGTEHAQGMAEYAMASARNRALAKAGKWAGIGGAGYMAEEAIKKSIQAVKP
jgi:hypothetical protein